MDKTKAEASEAADTTKQNTSQAASTAESKSSETSHTVREKAQEASDYTKQKSGEFADTAEKDYNKAKKELSKDGKKVSDGIKGEYDEIYENRDNPVVIANAVAIVAGTAALAYAGYQKHRVGELDWQLAGTAAAVVGVLGVGDYFLSQYVKVFLPPSSLNPSNYFCIHGQLY